MPLGLIGTAIAGGAQGLGEAGKQYGDYLSRSTLQDEAGKIQAQRDEVLQGYAQKNIRTTAETNLEFAPKIAEATTTATGTAQEPFKQKDSERRVTEQGAIATANAEAPIKAGLMFADDVRESQAKDAEAKAKIDAETLIGNMQNPEYVKALRQKVVAEHPPESSATVAQAKLATFQLGQAQQVAALQKQYADATASGDKVAAKSASDQISSLGFTGKWQNMAPLLTAGTALMKAADSELDAGTKAAMQAQAAVFFRQAGIGDGKDSAFPPPPASAIDALRKDPKLADQFKAKYGVDAAQYMGVAKPASSKAGDQAEPPMNRADVESRMKQYADFQDAEKHPEFSDQDREAFRSKMRELGMQLAGLINS